MCRTVPDILERGTDIERVSERSSVISAVTVAAVTSLVAPLLQFVGVGDGKVVRRWGWLDRV